MKELKKISFFIIISLLFPLCAELKAAETDNTPVSTKKERNHITKGNKLYEEGKYKDAVKEYQLALDENSSSVAGRYNLGLAEIRIGSNPNDTTEAAKRMLASGVKNMEQVANLGGRRPDLASKANYNLGNVAFNSQDYSKALGYYKDALRLNPEDDDARRNLRITQLKIQDQQQDQNQDQQQENQEQEDQQDQQEQNQDQQDQNQDQQDQNQNEQPQNNINQQTAEQILNAIENKENQTRAKVAGQNAEKSRQRNRNRRNW